MHENQEEIFRRLKKIIKLMTEIETAYYSEKPVDFLVTKLIIEKREFTTFLIGIFRERNIDIMADLEFKKPTV